MVRVAALVALLFPVLVSAGGSSRAAVVGGPDDAPTRGSSYPSMEIKSDPRREDLQAPSRGTTDGLTAASQPAGRWGYKSPTGEGVKFPLARNSKL